MGAQKRSAWQVWRDRRGRLSALRIAVLVLLLVPVAIALIDAQAIARGARPLNDLIHRTGFCALMFLMASLAVTPLRSILRHAALIDVRRMIGVAAFLYAAAHFMLYVADQQFNLLKVATEIVSRVYLTIGFTALIGLAVLAATSTDAMVRRLGGMNWRRLHQIAYLVALLSLIHFFQQTKSDVSVPTFSAAVFGWLMGYRLLARYRAGQGELPAWTLLGLSSAVAALTFLGEAVGIGIAFSVSPLRVLQMAFDFSLEIRPGWLVLGAGLSVVALDLLRSALPARRTRPASDRVTA
jgi:sulfoxide reductase heme-binding subunit YedZ